MEQKLAIKSKDILKPEWFSKIVQNFSDKIQLAYDSCDPGESVELETRLGIYDEDEGYFGSNIGDQAYDNILEMLESGKRWDAVSEEHTVDYISDGLRYSRTHSPDGEVVETCMRKKRLGNSSFVLEDATIDIRVSLSSETPVEFENFPEHSEAELVREKKRRSYFYKVFRYDLTEIKTCRPSEDTDFTEITYEFEVELLPGNLEKTRKDPEYRNYVCESLLLKTLDAVKAVGEVKLGGKARMH